MSDLREIYQEIIIDHGRHPKNFSEMVGASSQAQGFNPLCGDKITLYLRIENNIIEDITFQGSGCAISVASASLMTETLKGKTQTKAMKLFHSFHQLLTQSVQNATLLQKESKELDKLTALLGVRHYPMRVKCATLAWHALIAAFSQIKKIVSTENEHLSLDTLTLEKKIIHALRQINDPEIHVNIYDLGLIYKIDITPNSIVTIQMTLTTPNCPAAQDFPSLVENAIKQIEGVSEVNIELVWDPPWTQDKMSEAVKLQLGLL